MKNQNYIKLTLHPDDDGTGELAAEFYANGFCGIGSAWFHLAELMCFVEDLMAYPLPSSTIEIAGGYYFSESQKGLEQVHLALKVYTISRTGILGIRIRVATPIDEAVRPDSLHFAEAEVQTDYNKLESFAKQLKALINQEAEVAVLKGVEA